MAECLIVATWNTILVGVDGSPGSRTALAWAAAEAATHGAEVVALEVWKPPLLPPVGSGSVPHGNVPDWPGAVTEHLLTVIEDELGGTPPVLVHPRVKQGNAAAVLIDWSAHTDLLVVGSRGHGGFLGLALGSVSQHVAAYAKCPVTVVR